MYSIIVEPPNKCKPVIDRSMSSNNAIELLPVLQEICRSELAMKDPVSIYMGDNQYRIFDLDNPSFYALVTVIKNAN